MAIYWKLSSIPELADVPPEEHLRVFKAALKIARKAGAFRWINWLFWPGYFVVTVTTVLFTSGIGLLYDWPRWASTCAIIGVAFSLTVIAIIFHFVLVLRFIRPHIRSVLVAGE